MTTGTEAYYRARAAEYDRVYDKPERQPELAALREWLPRVLAGRRVLEVAAGTGYWTAAYADRAASVLATDASEETLQLARNRRSWPGTVRFAVADALGLPAVGASFDAVFVGFFWSHVPLGLLDSFLAGLARKLPDGARLACMDNRFVPGSNHPVTRTDADGNTYQLRQLDDGSSWEVLKNFPTAADLRQRLSAIGSDIEIEQRNYYWTAVCTCRNCGARLA
jgi:SAM-dependent methyltransferase